MREITQLQDKVERGTVGIEQLKKMLAFERNCLEPKVTLPTLGTLDTDMINREAAARQELDEGVIAANRNIPIIEGLLIKLGANTETPKPKPAHGDYAGNEDVDDGDEGFGL